MTGLPGRMIGSWSPVRRPRGPGAAPARWIAVALGLAAAVPGGAQETIASDRPGIGSASVVVAPGVLQAEFGTAWAGGPGPDALAIGQLLVRYGIAGVELEFLGNSWVNSRGEGANGADGFEDAAVGVKVPVARGIGDRADLSLQGLLTVPTGSEGLGSDEWIPTVVALADVALGEAAALGVNLGFSKGSGAVEDQVTASVTPSVGLTASLSAYAGWAGSFVDGTQSDWLEAGLAYLSGPDLQLDLNGAISPDTDRWFVGVGMAVRTGSR